MLANSFVLFGAGSRNRTGMGLPPLDFESSASTYFTTPAGMCLYSRNRPVLSTDYPDFNAVWPSAIVFQQPAKT